MVSAIDERNLARERSEFDEVARRSARRDLLITMTYGVVILSLLVQGLTMPWLLRWFGVVTASHERLTTETADSGSRR